MSEPTTLRAGDSIAWTHTVPDSPASAGWVLAYRLIWPNGTAVDITTTPVGDDFSVDLPAASTSAYTTGHATLASWVSRGADVYTLAQTAVEILPNLRTATIFDGRSGAEKRLEQARAALDSYLAGGKAHVASYDIGERKMVFRNSKELIDLIAFLESEVNKERAAMALFNGTGLPGRVHTRF